MTPIADPALSDTPVLPGTPPAIADRVATVATVATEHAAETDRNATFPAAALRAMRDTGLLGLLVPTEYGGLGGSLTDLVDAGITLGRSDMSVSMIFTMHCQQVAALAAYATEPLRGRLLAAIARGEVYLGSVTTEEGKGGHLLSSGSQLTCPAGQLGIERSTPICTGGAYADGFLITMRSPHATGDNQVSLVYADRDQLRIEHSDDWQPLGMRASHSVALRLSGQVPDHQVIGEHGRFRTIVTEVFGPLAHIGWSASWLGTASGALSRVVDLLRSPAGRSRYDLRSELLLTRLSRARQRTDTVHALLRHTTDVVERAPERSAPPVQLLLNALKITASEQAYAVVEDLIDAVGLRHGYFPSSPTGLERALRDLRSAALNYSNDRLHLADGRLTLMDAEVRLA